MKCFFRSFLISFFAISKFSVGTGYANSGGPETLAAKSISRQQPIISLSNSVLVLDYKRIRMQDKVAGNYESYRQEIYQEGDIIILTNNSNPLVAGKRLIVGPSPRVNITFSGSYHFRKGTRFYQANYGEGIVEEDVFELEELFFCKC